jgi:hypothetical protein
MRVLLDAVTLLAIGLLMAGLAALSLQWPFTNRGVGELRCETGGVVVVRVAGRDYAVNGMASSRYPPIQQVWNNDTHPGTNIDRLIARGLTLCDW